MTLHVRCECMWNAETKELTMRAGDCPVHTAKSKTAGRHLRQPRSTTLFVARH